MGSSSVVLHNTTNGDIARCRKYERKKKLLISGIFRTFTRSIYKAGYFVPNCFIAPMDWDDTDVMSREEGVPSIPPSGDGIGSMDREESRVINDYLDEVIKLEAAGLTDIGNLASWKVSSYKQGYGVHALRADTPLQFWQSDGPQPHNVDIHFSKRVAIERISLFTDYALDESYTPSKITVAAGTGYHDLRHIAALELDEPRGWNHIKLDKMREDGVVKAFLIRLSVVANHQNGKDTHIRGLKVFSEETGNTGIPTEAIDELIGFTGTSMLSESVIR